MERLKNESSKEDKRLEIDMLRRRVLNNQNKGTFDDLWDWKSQMAGYYGSDIVKKDLKIFQPKIGVPLEGGLPEEPVTLTKVRINHDSSQSRLMDESVDEEEKTIQELERMAEMCYEDIVKSVAKAKQAKKKKLLQENDKESSQMMESKVEMKSPTKTLKDSDFDAKLIFEEDDNASASFQISEENDNPEVDPELLSRFRDVEGDGSASLKLKTIFRIKSFIRRKKISRLGNLGKEDRFQNTIRGDEDFMEIGGVKIGEMIGVVPPKPFEDDALPITKEEIKPVIDDTKKEAEGKENASGKGGIVLKKKKKEKILSKGPKKPKDKKKEEKLSPEQEAEQNMIKVYEKGQNKYLKLEVKYDYDKIPERSFNSILDVSPIYIQAAKVEIERTEEKKLNDHKLVIIYNSAHTKKKKKTKKEIRDEEKAKQEEEAAKGLAFSGISLENANSLSNSELKNTSISPSEDEGDPDLDGSLKPAEDHRHTKSIQLKRTLEEITRNIVHKTHFPINASTRTQAILKTFNEAAVEVKSNQVIAKKETGGKRKFDYAEENSAVAERFEIDLNEVETQLVENEVELENNTKNDFSYLYKSIRSKDFDSQEISKVNWSGDHVIPLSGFSKSQTAKSIAALNYQVLDIWLVRFAGFIKTTRRYFKSFIDSSPINSFLLVSVLLNTAIMGADGLAPEDWNAHFDLMNLIFTGIFTAELTIKLYGYGTKDFSKDLFNVFDAFVVLISLVELVINSSSGQQGDKKNAASAFRAIRIFRIFRVLRVTRLLRGLRFMQIIIEVLKSTLEQFVYIAILMFLFIFIFSLLGMQMFGGKFVFQGGEEIVRFNFDSFTSAFYTVFVLITMENWNTILINALRSSNPPYLTMAYLLIWIFIGNYIFLNLFLAILLEGFESSSAGKPLEEYDDEQTELEAMYKRKIEEVKEKKELLEKSENEASKRFLMIVEPQNFKKEKEINQSQGCYHVIRDVDQDGDSLEEELSMKNEITKSFNSSKGKVDIFEGVEDEQVFYYFSKINPFRKFCASVASHPRYSPLESPGSNLLSSPSSS
jgi:hypothetical protein